MKKVMRHIHWLGKGMVRDDEIGPFVFYTDYAKLEAERDELQDEHARICRGWMSICGTQENEIEALTAERDALRGVLEEISHDEGRFGLSASDMRELAKQVLARTALGGGE